jgi:hypothetical protein
VSIAPATDNIVATTRLRLAPPLAPLTRQTNSWSDRNDRRRFSRHYENAVHAHKGIRVLIRVVLAQIDSTEARSHSH